jgi:diguanylate cyclase (GGDEF)-like protein
MRIPRFFLGPRRPLPDAIHIELVSMLISGRLPILVVALTILCVAGFSYWTYQGPIVPPLTLLILILLGFRWRIVTAFRRERRERGITIERALHWEKRYRRIVWAYALAFGLLNFRVGMVGDASTHLLVTAAIFGFCAGQVTRASVRPRFCASTILLAAVPTALGMLIPAMTAASEREGMTYLVLGLLILIYAVSCLETVRYLYATILDQLVSKRHLTSLASIDPLTGLPNRLLMRERIEDDLAAVEENGGTLALHLIDLDGFKAVNDRFGHPAGDALLRMVAERLSSILRPGDTAVRMGGDEFAIIQTALASRDEAEMLARRLLRALREPFALAAGEVSIAGSCGIALAPGDAQDMDTLVECADAALYEAKRSGRGNLRFCRVVASLAPARAA